MGYKATKPTELELLGACKNVGISPALRFLFVGQKGDSYYADHRWYYLVLSDKHVFYLKAEYVLTEADLNHKRYSMGVVATLSRVQRPHYSGIKVPEDMPNSSRKEDNINVLYDYWLDYKQGIELEDNIKEIGSDLKIYESRVQSESMAEADTRRISELYKTIQNMRETAIQTESEHLNEIEGLLESAQGLQTKIEVQGDYVAGDKAQLKDSHMTTDQSITAHDSVVTLTDRKRIQLLEDKFLQGDVSEKTYLHLKNKYVQATPLLEKIK